MSLGLAVAQAGEMDRPKSDAIDWLPTAKTPLADAALRYAEHGLVVIPLHGIDPATLCCLCGQNDCNAGKHPIEKGWQHQHPDVSRTRRQFAQYRDANIGLVMGGPCRLCTLDIDGPQGREALAGLERKLGALPATLISRSGRVDGGEHRLFGVPETFDMAAIKNRSLAPHVDVRTTGGQIVVAPSLHRSGNRYAWANYGPLAALPEAWYQHMVGPQEPPRHLAKPRPLTAPRVSRSAYSKRVDQSTIDDRKKEYVRAALQKACEAIRKAPDGSRNDVLNTQTYSIAGLVASGHLDAEQAYPTLEEAAIEAGLQVAEIQTTMASAIRNGEARPREIPEPRKTRSNALPAKDLEDTGNHNPEIRGEPPWSIQYTDVLNTEQFVREHGESLRYCQERDWFRWDATRWVHDSLAPSKPAQQTARRIAAQVIQDGLEKPGKVIERILRSSSVSAMIYLARPHLAARIEMFDADPWLFNCANGTLDLRTGSLRPHNHKDLITRQSPVVYDPDATCPKWHEHLEKVMPSEAVRAYLQRLAGYWLTGVICEHVLPVQWGDGGNGKGVTFNTLLHVWGDYGKAVPPELLMQRDGHDEHPTELAQLCGLRLAVASETKQNRHFNEAMIKMLTGGDSIAARYMRQDYFTFQPTHKLALLTNYKPIVSGTDRGIWRRLRLVPWTVNIPEAEQDTALEETLRAEAPGILAWAVQGCLAWQRDGLAAPAEVTEATQEFRAASDVLGRFFADCCRIDKALLVGSTALFQAYTRWCNENGERPASQKAFGTDLVRHVPSVTREHGRSGWFYRGIGVVDPDVTDGPVTASHPSEDSQRESCAVTDVTDVTDCPISTSTRTRKPLIQSYPSHPSHPSQPPPLGAPSLGAPPSGSPPEGRFQCPRHGTDYRPECGSCGSAFDDDGNLIRSVQ